MTYQNIIEAAQKLTPEEKEKLIYFLLNSSIDEQKKKKVLDLLKNDEEYKKPVFGAMKGLIEYMSDDFDQPLEDLKDYINHRALSQR